MDTPRAILADNIKHQIEVQDLGTNSLADFAGVSRSQLYDVLAERKGASVDWVEKLAEALKVEPFQLLRRRSKRAKRRDN